jgi:competence protein ComEC
MKEKLSAIDTLSAVIVVSLVVLDSFVWFTIFQTHAARAAGTRDYFLDVGQGDGELIIFSENIKVMTDAGPLDRVLDSLEKVLSQNDHYIDLAIISHPQLDHFNGYNFMLDSGYRFGAFIYNGRDDGPSVTAWPQLIQKIKEKNIPLITLGAGDRIRYEKNEVDMLSPDKAFAESAELNDTGFVELVKTPEFRTLLTADIGFNVENYLVKGGFDIRADVLKVGHHGSRYSSGDAFLEAVNPKIAAVEVGAKNTYGHPGKETLARLASSTKAKVFRTDRNGTIEVWSDKGKLKFLLYNEGK